MVHFRDLKRYLYGRIFWGFAELERGYIFEENWGKLVVKKKLQEATRTVQLHKKEPWFSNIAQ
jgi:hypothetical protein